MIERALAGARAAVSDPSDVTPLEDAVTGKVSDESLRACATPRASLFFAVQRS